MRFLGLRDYTDCLAEMQRFTAARGAVTQDEIWVLEHSPVFTLGIRGGREHLLAPGLVPVVQSDRGGQVTYHGPGQLVVYPLLDLARLGIGMRQVSHALVRTVIVTLACWGVSATKGDSPGVYVGRRKIASIGLRLSRRCTYHGVALNVCNELGPFRRIHPCGERGLEMTSLVAEGGAATVQDVSAVFAYELLDSIRQLAGANYSKNPRRNP